jgi:hypothetical protein
MLIILKNKGGEGNWGGGGGLNKAKSLCVSFESGFYPGPEERSLAWVFKGEICYFQPCGKFCETLRTTTADILGL